jgi:hypothetical protein
MTTEEAQKLNIITIAIMNLIDESWQTAEDHGWHDPIRTVGEDIALMHSELSEALEEYRDGTYATNTIGRDYHGKPVGIPVELADVLIRIFDFCKVHDINLAAALRNKLNYNKTRSHRHGDKKL